MVSWTGFPLLAAVSFVFLQLVGSSSAYLAHLSLAPPKITGPRPATPKVETRATVLSGYPKSRGVRGVRFSSKISTGEPRQDVEASGSARKKSKSTSRAKKKKQVQKKSKSKEPPYWSHPSDSVAVTYGPSNEVSSVQFKIRGNPRPLVRHRTSRGFTYNPSANLQKTFQKLVEKEVVARENLSAPIFNGDVCLVMSIVFRMKRPLKDFVGSKRDPDRLRENAQPQTTRIRQDVDNLTKFVLDSMNEVLYDDDSQISSLHVTKLLDNDGLCEGSTEVIVQRMTEEDLETLISNSFSILKT